MTRATILRKRKRAFGMEATRSNLIQHARQLFQEKGYADASVAQLVARAGGSKETIYRHFKDKRDLLSAVFSAEIDHYDTVMGQFRAHEPHVRVGLVEYAEGILIELTSARGVALRQMMIAEAGSRPEVGRLFYSKYFSTGYVQLESRLREYQVAGHLRPIDTAHLAEYFGAMLLYRVMLKRQCGVAEPITRPEARRLARRVVNDFLIGFGA